MYLHDWVGSGLEGMCQDFEVGEGVLADCEVLLASYTYECYEGSAFVLFQKGGELFEVNAYHCSCYGLEGKWEPEETTVAALRNRVEQGNLGSDGFKDELISVLDKLEGTPDVPA